MQLKSTNQWVNIIQLKYSLNDEVSIIYVPQTTSIFQYNIPTFLGNIRCRFMNNIKWKCIFTINIWKHDATILSFQIVKRITIMIPQIHFSCFHSSSKWLITHIWRIILKIVGCLPTSELNRLTDSTHETNKI